MTDRLTRRALLATGTTVVVASCATRPLGAPATPAAVEPPSPSVVTVTPTLTVTPAPTPSSSPVRAPQASSPASTLVGDTRNAWAFASLGSPADVVVEGSVPSERAWSTSKVLVVAAFLQRAVAGDPGRLSAEQRRLITAALTASDMTALRAIRSAIPGDHAAAMTEVLQSFGDRVTIAPAVNEGTMIWRIRDQVRFMAALARGAVVSAPASAYVLSQLQPIATQRWGLPGVGATATKGGWLRSTTETRQMGILDGHAVAIITAGVGPALLQSDGDSAHVEQMNALAAMLKQRLAG